MMKKSMQDTGNETTKLKKSTFFKAKSIFIIFLLTFFLGIMSIGGIFSMLLSDLTNTRAFYYDKITLEKNIASILNNKGTLELIIFEYELMMEQSFPNSIILNNNDKKLFKAKAKPTLSEVLMEIKVQAFKNPETSLVQNIEKLSQIIEEYNSTNPFDKLESQQKDLFKSLKLQSDTSYSDIEYQVNKIVDELDYKNKLVERYLSKANSSFRNSIIAMSLSFLSLTIVIILNFRNLFRFSSKKAKETTTTDIDKSIL